VKRVTRIVGVVFMVASLIFVADRIRVLIADAGRQRITGADVARLVAAVPVYFVALTLFHVAWSLLLRSAVRADERSLRRAWTITARASIGKYLPGNVAHFAGRQVLVARVGWPQMGAAGASMVETVALPGTGLLIVLVGLVVAPDLATRLLESSSPLTLVVLSAVALSLVAVAWTLRNSPRVVELLRYLAGFRTVMWKVVGCYAAFFLISGVVQAWLIGEQDVIRVVLASTTAWIAGYLAPGVPAGLGVREAILVLLLDIDGTAVAVGVIGFRLVMVVADLLVFAVGSVLSTQGRSGVVDRDGPGDQPLTSG
jgi:glycosyltransferase 2 family protein